MKKAKAEGQEVEDLVSSLDVGSVEDIHCADAAGTPLYANFKFEDWVLLGWRYELHLLAHSFAADVDDPDRPAMPEVHVDHYYERYFGRKIDTKQIGAENLVKALKVLKEPLELADQDGKYKTLRSKLDEDTPLEAFVKGIEVYRRDRVRRVDAGDESARLLFPRAQKPAAASTTASQGLPGRTVGSVSAPQTSVAKTPPPKAGAVVAKTPPGSVRPASPAAVRPTLPAAANGVVAGAASGVKRPVSPKPPVPKQPATPPAGASAPKRPRAA